VIDTTTNPNTVVATVAVGAGPNGVAVTPDGKHVYVTNSFDGTVSVMETTGNTVMATVTVGGGPLGVAVTPDGKRAYVTDTRDMSGSKTVSVIETNSNTVVATVEVGSFLSPLSSSLTNGVAITPDGKHAYVTTSKVDDTVLVIETTGNTVMTTIPVGLGPFGVAVTPDGKHVYVTNLNDHNVSVIETTGNTVMATVPVGGVAPWGSPSPRTGNTSMSRITLAPAPFR
jgi:YVTN family beta-propeller protein